jgi:general secretion pathway protein K
MRPLRRGARGVTLVIVLWIVAALTILVTGLVQAQRSELRLAAAARAQLLSTAAGQAAMQIVAQQLAAATAPDARLRRALVEHAGRGIEVEVMPLNGLVDLNTAPGPLLEDLFLRAGGLDEGAARSLVAALLARRQPGPPGGRDGRFEAPEELLSLPGVDPDLFARLAPLVTTDAAGSGRVNALAAPAEVLVVLARGNVDLARRVADERDAGAVGADTTRLEATYTDATVSSRYRLTAHVPEPDGSRTAVRFDIDLRPPAAPGQPPWRVLRTRSQRLVGAVQGLTVSHGVG